MNTRLVHFDTTSVSVEGDYNRDSLDSDFNIFHGHSKNYKPDLKQVKIGLIVSVE